MLTLQNVSDKILEYATPNSGTVYGFFSGYNGTILKNRKAFIEIRDNLTNDQVIFLMYSINPVSRLTAFEYYIKNRKSFIEQASIEEWMEINLKEVPIVETSFGCIRESFDTRTLLQMYSSINDK